MTATHQLYFSADELRDALKRLGHPATLDEATIAVAVETFATLIDRPPPAEFIDDPEATAWRIDHFLPAETARQAGRPCLIISPMDLPGDTE